MQRNYADFALLFKALADETRLKIVDMLSAGELCACDILKGFNITQPTLSYHMKILSECGLVNADRRGAWMHYTLNAETVNRLADYWNHSMDAALMGGEKQCCDGPSGDCGCKE